MSDHEDETITAENAPPKNIPQITTVTNISAKFPYLKKGEYDIWAMKMQNFISNNDGNLKIHPPVTAEEHQHVQREEKARKINAIKARFSGNAESKKMQKSLLKQKFEEFKVSVSAGDVVAAIAHKHAVKSLEKQIKCHQTNQLAYGEKIRVLSYELKEKSNILEYRQKLIDQPAQEKQELMSKLDNEITNQAKWNNSGRNLYKLIDSSMSVRTKQGLGVDKYIGEGKLGIDDSKVSIFHTNSDDLEGKHIYNRFASVDHMKAVPPSLTGNYLPPSNIPDIDESQMVYGKKATDSSKIKTTDDSITHTYDSILFYFSDRSSEPSTNDLKMCNSSVECSRPNHSDHDSNDSISSVSAPASKSRDTIVIDCARQEDFPSVCTSSIETDVKSSNTLCNKFGSFNKESHFRKHKSVTSKSCYVCGSYLYLIKDCDFYEQRFAKRNAEGKGILKTKPTGKPVNPNRPKPVSTGRPKPIFAGRPDPVSAGRPIPVSAVQPNPVFAGQPNTISAGDGILSP
nr:xylulose kinase-1 [Tanacetum cinerariifolium]